jgi:uncharacterized membrane protein YhaH (DUF805 family)
MGVLHLFFSLQGRISRLGFWLGLIGVVLIGSGLAAYLLSEVFGQNIAALQPAALAKPAQQLMALLSLILIYPLLAVVTKRLHDRGRSMWNALPVVLACLIPAGVVFAGLTERVFAVLTGSANPVEIIGVALYGLLLLVILIDLGLFAGEVGVNRFGPDPRRQ